MKLRKLAAAAAAVAIAASAFTVQGFAAGNKMELLTVPLSEIDGATGIGAMYWDDLYRFYTEEDDLCKGFISITDDNLDSWRESGEFSYNEVTADGIDLSNSITVFGSCPQIAYKDEDGNYIKRLAYSFNGTDELTVKYESEEWFLNRDDGYMVSCNSKMGGAIYEVIVTAPDGKEKTVQIDEECYRLEAIESRFSDKYVAYIEIPGAMTEGTDSEFDNGEYWSCEITIKLIDKNGNFVSLEPIDAIYFYWLNDGVFWYNQEGALYEAAGAKIDFDKAELVSVPMVRFGTAIPTLEVYGDVAIAKTFEGYYLHNLKSGSSEYRIGGSYQSMSTGDNGKKFLVQTQDGKWGFLNSKGKLLATFDDAGSFIGDYAPVVENGKAYLVDRSMNRVSEKIDADGVSTIGADLFFVTIDDEYYLMTYVPSESDAEEPADDNTDVDVEEPDDNVDVEEPGESVDVEEPDESVDVEEPDESVDVILDESTDSESTPADNADADANTDNADAADTTPDNPKTGTGSIALVSATLVCAAGAMLLSRKRR